jgi:phage-related minor tail protein
MLKKLKRGKGGELVASMFALFEMQDRISAKLDNLTRRTEKYAEASQQLAKVGAMAFVAIGAAAVTAGTAVMHVSDNLNKALNGVQASTGMAEAEMSGLKDTMLSIYNNNFGENFQDIGKSLSTVKQITHASGIELEKLTTNALMLRDIFEFEVNESTRAASTMMKQFGISGDQAFTLIAQAAQNGADKNGDLLDTFNEYSVQFKSLGFNADQFTNALIDGAKNGAWSIDKVGDAIKEFNIRSKDGSKASAEGFASLGLDAEAMTAEFAKGGSSAQAAFQTVISSLESITDPIAQNAAGVALFGTQFEDLEAQAIISLGHVSNTANSAADTLQQINAVKYKDFGSAVTGIGRQLETGILVPLGEKLLPSLNGFGSWITANMPAILTVVMTVFSWIGNEIEYLANNFDVYGPVFAAVIATILIPALFSWANAAWATATANIAAMAPLLAIVLFVGFVVYKLAQAWKNNFLSIRDITGTVATFIMNMFNAVVNYVTTVWGYIGPFIMTSLQFIYTMFATFFGLIGDIISFTFSIIGMVIHTALSYVLGMVTGFFQILTGDFGGGAATIIQTLNNLVENITNLFVSLVMGAFNIGADFANGIINGFSGLIGGLVDAAKNVWNKVTGIFSGQQSTSLGDLANAGVSAGSILDGSHANGLSRVPFDGYIAELHQGEAVLTAREAEQYRKLSPEKAQQVMNTSSSSTNTSNDNRVNVGSLFGNVTVNNQSDISKVVKQIEEYLQEQLNSSGEGVYDV